MNNASQLHRPPQQPTIPIPQLDPNTYQELDALRAKLWSLQETFSTHLAYLREPKMPFNWPDLLNKFNMLTAKFATLSEDFYKYTELGSNATLTKLMIHPHIPTQNEHDSTIQGILLRTKLITEIEKLEAETQATIAKDLLTNSEVTSSAPTRNLDDEQVIQNQIKQWHQLLSRHDRLATDAARFVGELASDHKSNFLLRYEDQLDLQDLEGDEEMDIDEEEVKKEEKEWEKMGFPSEDVWKKWKLECMLNFYSSGKSEVVGSDLKKLATKK